MFRGYARHMCSPAVCAVHGVGARRAKHVVLEDTLSELRRLRAALQQRLVAEQHRGVEMAPPPPLPALSNATGIMVSKGRSSRLCNCSRVPGLSCACMSLVWLPAAPHGVGRPGPSKAMLLSPHTHSICPVTAGAGGARQLFVGAAYHLQGPSRAAGKCTCGGG